MEALLLILLLAVVAALNIVCFMVGANVGQKVSKGESIEITSASPQKAVREHKAHKEADMEQNRVDTIMRNVEAYDGTPYGQEDVPGR
jgi:hypothetical protein